MNRFFKLAAALLVVVGLLAVIATLIESSPDGDSHPTFSTFLTQLDQGKVDTVTLNRKASVFEYRLKGAKKTIKIGWNSDDGGVLERKLFAAEEKGLLNKFVSSGGKS